MAQGRFTESPFRTCLLIGGRKFRLVFDKRFHLFIEVRKEGVASYSFHLPYGVHAIVFLSVAI